MKAGIHCKKGIEIMYDVDVMVKYRDQFYHECSDIVERSHVYRNHINKFIEYLSQPEVNLVDSPTMIDKHTVEDCIGYYHEKGEINTRATMESHLESLKKFYKYLNETGKSDDIFAEVPNYGKFKNDIVARFGLSEPNERGYYSSREIKELLLVLDNAIESHRENNAGIREEERYLQRIILRLFIKITLIAPAKRSVIINLKKSDIKENYKKIYINNVNINVPNGLTRDIKYAIAEAQKRNNVNIKEEDNLFEYIYRYKGKFGGEKLNAWLCNIVQDFGVLDRGEGKKSLGVEPIRNTAIKMMVDNMINPVLISKISGITLGMIESTYYSKDWTIKYEEDLDRSINRAIAQNDYYSYI